MHTLSYISLYVYSQHTLLYMKYLISINSTAITVRDNVLLLMQVQKG